MEFTSIGADVHGFLRSEIVVLVSGVILCRGSYVRGFYVRGFSRPWVLISRSSYVFFILHFFFHLTFFSKGKENVRESEQEGWGGDGIGERLDMGVCRVPLCYVITPYYRL